MLVLRGCAAAILATAAPWVAAFYEADVLQPMLQVLAAVFVIGGLANINTIARQKELDFRQLTYLGLATSIAGTIVTIAAAFWLRSVWALVIGQLATSAVNSLLSYFFIGGRPRFAWNREIARELLTCGSYHPRSYCSSRWSWIAVSASCSGSRLGLYAGFTIANIATANLSKMASSIMMPATALQDDQPALQRAYLRTLSLVMFVVLPASAGLVLAAEPLLVVVYGAKWLPAVVPLQILAVFGLMRALAAFSGYMFEGIGEPKVAFQLGLMRLALIAPVIVPVTKAFGLRARRSR
jgi:PST family polysaccharide transporter/lipopolysaccharide exporter